MFFEQWVKYLRYLGYRPEDRGSSSLLSCGTYGVVFSLYVYSVSIVAYGIILAYCNTLCGALGV